MLRRLLFMSLAGLLSLGASGCGGNAAYEECRRAKAATAAKAFDPEAALERMCEQHCDVDFWSGENDC